MVSWRSGFLLSVFEGSDGGINRLAGGRPREADSSLEANRMFGFRYGSAFAYLRNDLGFTMKGIDKLERTEWSRDFNLRVKEG